MPIPRSQYFLKTFGLPELRHADGAVVDFPLGKPFALLTYLVLCEEPPTRNDLAVLFWHGVARSRALQSTRQALFLIRRTLGDVVVEDEQAVSIVPDTIECDVTQL